MKKILIILFSLGISMPMALSQTEALINPDMIFRFTFEGRTYDVVKLMKTWDDAAKIATARGGKLVEINSRGEQNVVFNAIINDAGITQNYTSVIDGGGIAYVWIGATDKVTEGKWMWDGNNSGNGLNFWNGQGNAGKGDGKVINNYYVNWGGASKGVYNEPDDHNGQDMAAMGLTAWPLGSGTLGMPGEWNDLDGSNELYFVIEYTLAAPDAKEREQIKDYFNPDRH